MNLIFGETVALEPGMRAPTIIGNRRVAAIGPVGEQIAFLRREAENIDDHADLLTLYEIGRLTNHNAIFRKLAEESTVNGVPHKSVILEIQDITPAMGIQLEE